MAEYEIKSPMWTKDKTLYRPGKRDVSPEHAKELGLDKSADTETAGGGGSLDGVQFASSAARTAAEEAGMVAADFAGRKGSSPDGFTKPDVVALIEAQDGAEQG